MLMHEPHGEVQENEGALKILFFPTFYKINKQDKVII